MILTEKVCSLIFGVVKTVIAPLSCPFVPLLFAANLAGTDELFGTLESLASLDADPHVHIPESRLELFRLGRCSRTERSSRLSTKRQNKLR